ncbi:N2227-like protein-domain-containing protein [Gilbertella persicaria]|uniref:N2227-like protein-domain-containing protein n=1 Tax=Gilbertella persicaria TaxID=101096 RepID=UPI00221EC0DF|nr:N2227-like protein-domain-containing protein [Gilbertella persicaria]KAI8047951.1 N2227-like protein-domain-containing protein [Gilbertella persicaria]
MHHHETAHDPTQSEQFHLVKVITAFAYYRRHALNHNHRRRRDYLALPEHHKQLIPDYLHKVDNVDKCIEENMNFIRHIVKSASMFLDGQDPMTAVSQHQQQQKQTNKPPVTPMDMDKVRSTLKQFVRDWSMEGEAERKATYDPIVQALNNIFKDIPIEKRGDVRVLVPGAGLGRLAFDIAKAGKLPLQYSFSCQGNEFSYYMLFASHFVLNRLKKPQEHSIFPFVHSFSNIQSDENQLRPVKIPDMLPSDLPSTVDFSMVAGDFIEVYGAQEHKGAWDVVVTCFFLDTAKNIIEYMEVIHKALKPNGVWINIGPLLYHFEDSTSGDSSIELSLDQVKEVAKKIGFEFKQQDMVSTTYTSNPDGMLKYVYNCAFWTAVKL